MPFSRLFRVSGNKLKRCNIPAGLFSEMNQISEISTFQLYSLNFGEKVVSHKAKIDPLKPGSDMDVRLSKWPQAMNDVQNRMV